MHANGMRGLGNEFRDDCLKLTIDGFFDHRTLSGHNDRNLRRRARVRWAVFDTKCLRMH